MASNKDRVVSLIEFVVENTDASYPQRTLSMSTGEQN